MTSSRESASTMADSRRLHARLVAYHQRLAVRAWAYRQRHRSKGVWDRVRVVLARAERVWALDEAAAQALTDCGVEAEPAGLELEPPRRIFRVTAPRPGWIEVPVDERRWRIDLLTHRFR